MMKFNYSERFSRSADRQMQTKNAHRKKSIRNRYWYVIKGEESNHWNRRVKKCQASDSNAICRWTWNDNSCQFATTMTAFIVYSILYVNDMLFGAKIELNLPENWLTGSFKMDSVAHSFFYLTFIYAKCDNKLKSIFRIINSRRCARKKKGHQLNAFAEENTLEPFNK